MTLSRQITTAFIVCGCLTFNSAAPAQGTATISGCITQPNGAPLRGVTVDVGGDGPRRQANTDASGCYAVPNVPAGLHYVFARLPGFVGVTRDNLTVPPDGSVTVNFQMRLAPLCECLPLPMTLSALWDDADAVVRVRITGHDSSNPTKHLSATLRVWKRIPSVNIMDTLTFVQPATKDEVEPYAIGQDFVLFLMWSSREQAFVRLSSLEGIVFAFAIEDGRIHSAPFPAYVSMELSQLESELASWSGQ